MGHRTNPVGPSITSVSVLPLTSMPDTSSNPHAMHGIPSQTASNLGTTEGSLVTIFWLSGLCLYVGVGLPYTSTTLGIERFCDGGREVEVIQRGG